MFWDLSRKGHRALEGDAADFLVGKNAASLLDQIDYRACATRINMHKL